MNKEILYALERIKHTDLYEADTETDEAIFQGECGDIYKHEFEIIETELKRTSDYDFLGEHYRECLKENEKLNKALEDYEMIKGSVCIAQSVGLDLCRKRDKALEIIKELFDIKIFETAGKYFITVMSKRQLFSYRYRVEIKTQEEFDLLKEVLL